MSPLLASAVPCKVQTHSALPSEADWTSIRPIFEQLYIEEHNTLAHVISELRRKYNFRATPAMYKRRIREWGLGKNLRQHEVEHILGISAQRRAQGKGTYFLLRGKKVDMHDVRAFQRRRKVRAGDAIAAYTTGRSKECRELRALTPEHIDSSAWSTPDQSYENALRAFSALFYGLVDSRYYWVESSEIVMPPSVLRGEMSDVCTSLVASKTIGELNMLSVRKLALLLESIVFSEDAWIHCRLIYTLWVISTAGHPRIVKTLLAHLSGLVAAYLGQACAQYRFVQFYSGLQASHTTKLAADMISLKAQMVEGFRMEENPAAFKLRSLDYDVFWRRREQGDLVTPARAIDLLERSEGILGPLAVETLTVLRAILQDDIAQPSEFDSLARLLEFLGDSKKLDFRDSPKPRFTYDGQSLGMEAASELACIYCQLGLHEAEAWIFSRLLVHQKQTASGLRREYSLLIHISRCAHLTQDERGQAWLQRKQEIEGIWRTEVEAAAPTKELVAGVGSKQKRQTRLKPDARGRG